MNMTIRSTSSIFCLSIIAIVSFFASRSGAQQQPNGLKITEHSHDLLSITSRDYWVAFPENYSGDGGKQYIMLYVSSVDSTTAYIEVNGQIDTLAVVPGQPVVYNVPLIWEMTTSDTVENKALHVWSNDAALFVDFNSHIDYTSDASYVIPNIGWGLSYIVAAYESFNDSNYSHYYDMPSEFVIIADQDSTSVMITPATDLRSTRGDSSLVYKAGMPFTIQMGRGQAVQYKAVKITNTSPFDVTGTTIFASKHVGVVGATECANIPANYPYCDFICEMIPPIRTWGKTYYTAPLYGRVGGDTYLAIGTMANQKIIRTDANGTGVFAKLANPHDHYWQHDIATPSSWTSNAPFLLVQYSNSSTWPAGINGNYDPFMMAVNSIDHFSTPVIFNVLHNSLDQLPYFWHADIVARSGLPVYIDGTLLTSDPIYDDNSYAVYQLDSLEPRQYSVASDSGVSVSVYGDGFDEAVGYSGMIGVSTTESMDIAAPKLTVTPSSATKTTVSASDISYANMSGLSHFEIDKISNMRLDQDKSFVEGNGSETGNFDLVVADPTKPAHATVRVVDMAGNYTTVVKDYDPSAASVAAGMSATPVSVAPNPASSNFNFKYSLEADNHVSLDLFDLLGNRVLSLVNGNQSVGAHSVSADTHLLPIGDYFYRLEIGSVVQSGREVVSR